jgi:transcriptional regulator with XRE-family HTH domain
MKQGKTKSVAKRRPRELSPFSALLVKLMREKNMTVRTAAKIANVGASTLVNWRSGALPEDFRAVRALSKALGVSFSFLLTGEDDSRPEGAPGVNEVFLDGGSLFDGYARVQIQRLIPKKKDEK